jgi:N-succinyldiaminopimelate aminotransferase
MHDRMHSLGDGPFRRLAQMVEPITPAANVAPIDLSIGDPRTGFPAFVADILASAWKHYGRYPPPKGTPDLRRAIAAWLTRRYRLPSQMIDPDRHVVPVAGTKEGMFLMAQAAVPDTHRGGAPVVLMPNPYYHAYAGAAVAARAEPVFVPATRDTGFLPDFAALDPAILDRTALCFVGSPSNPQGAVANLDYLRSLVGLARAHDFVLVVDECYAEIYDRDPPPGALEACASIGDGLANVIVFHSLSKRSSAPGLRVGFAAGDPDRLDAYVRLRSYGGATIPLPIDAAAAALWRDEAHVERIRANYRSQFDAAERILAGRFGFYRPAGGFFLWLDVGDGVAAVRTLWSHAAVKMLPGAFISREVGGFNPGLPYIRIPLVHEALDRIVRTLSAEAAA